MTASPDMDAGPTDAAPARAVLEMERGARGLVLRLSGRLDAYTTGAIWRRALNALEGDAARVIVDGSRIEYCDAVGIALLLRLEQRARELGGEARIEGLAERFRALLDQYDASRLYSPRPQKRKLSALAEVGSTAASLWREVGEQVVFVGRLAAVLPAALVGRRRVRWEETFRLAQEVGADAFPLVAMISFMVGAIISLKSAHSLAQFGAMTEMAALNIKAISSELAPLLTTIIVVGRSTSAFAAELGAMRVNEEVDALTVMGIDPVPYLVTSRVFAGAFAVPMLTLFFGVFGIIGGLFMWRLFGFSAESYLLNVRNDLLLSDILGSLVKAVVFGMLTAMLGCFYGLRRSAESGAESVAGAATRAVVAGMVVISLADALFAVLFYFLGV